jgi:hypothetical protein
MLQKVLSIEGDINGFKKFYEKYLGGRTHPFTIDRMKRIEKMLEGN